MYETDPEAKRVIDVAKGLEGLRRGDGIHAAAVVITDLPLTEYVPIQRKPDSNNPDDAPIVTQYEMHGVEDLGLLKMDFLGLRNLSVIERALDLIEVSTGERPDIDNIPLDDEPTFAMLRQGDSMGVFQLEGGPMRSLMRSLAPTTFDDVAALVALYRPGPMAANMHRDYADRKNGRQPVTYAHPDLEAILADTYGLMIYQESVMRVAQKFAGYTLAEADNLRKACGKKIRALIQAEREKFVAGLRRRGLRRGARHRPVRHHRALRRLRLQQVPLLRLRVHRLPDGVVEGPLPGRVPGQPAHLGQGQQGQDRHLPRRVPVARHRGARPRRQPVAGRVHPGLHRRRGRHRHLGRQPGAITFGLAAVRNVGEALVALIVAEREADGPFVDFYDFCQRVDPQVLNKRTIESLDQGRAPSTRSGHPRQGLFLIFEEIVDRTLERRREHDAGVMSLFAPWRSRPRARRPASPTPGSRSPTPSSTSRSRLAFEKEMLGPLHQRPPADGPRGVAGPPDRLHPGRAARLRPRRHGRLGLRRRGRGQGRSAGSITELQRRYTKKGDLMATFVLEDLQRLHRGLRLPEDDGRLRRPARRRRHRGRQGRARHARRAAQAGVHGGLPARAGAPTASVTCGSPCRSAPSPTGRWTTSSACCPSTRATPRSCSTWARRCCGCRPSSTSTASRGLMGELRVLLGPRAIQA